LFKADESSCTLGFAALLLLGWLRVQVRSLRGHLNHVDRGISYRGERGDQVSEVKHTLAISPPIDPPEVLAALILYPDPLPFPNVFSLVCCLLTDFDRKSKAVFAVSTSQAAGETLLGLSEMERMSPTDKRKALVSKPLGRRL